MMSPMFVVIDIIPVIPVLHKQKKNKLALFVTIFIGYSAVLSRCYKFSKHLSNSWVQWPILLILARREDKAGEWPVLPGQPSKTLYLKKKIWDVAQCYSTYGIKFVNLFKQNHQVIAVLDF